MKKEWRITVWGVRGSAPRPSPDCMEHGGNTACISLEHGDHTVILDAGTGLAPLGQVLSAREGPKRLDILLSHLHIDHVLGLYTFSPFFDPDAEIHLYGRTGAPRPDRVRPRERAADLGRLLRPLGPAPRLGALYLGAGAGAGPGRTGRAGADDPLRLGLL